MPVLPWRNDADGFAFSNAWTLDAAERATLSSLVTPLIPGVVAAIVPDPTLWIPLIVAANAYISFGANNTYGLCGGMAYVALDHWNARVPLPRGASETDQPSRDAPVPAMLRDLIWRRLLDSLGPGGVLRGTLEWSLLLNQVPSWLGGGAEGLRNRTLLEWDKIRNHIDAGRPWPIGLIITGRDVWNQHQILVYGYENTGFNQGKLFIYENNHPSQFGDSSHRELLVDFSGPTLVAAAPSGPAGTLAGFFCSNYFSDRPLGLAKSYGEFLNWNMDPRTWMVTDGARMPILDAAELSALGGTAQDVRSTGKSFIPSSVRPRDGAMFRERSSAPVFLYAGGAPFWIPDPTWLDRFGGPGQVRIVPDNTLAAFAGLPDEETLLREWSDGRVWRIMGGVRRWVRTPQELAKWGGFPSVRVVPDGALAGITEGLPLPVEPARTWNWTNLSKPAGVNIRATMGAISVMDTPSSPQRPHVFVEGNDSNLWCRFYDGSAWQWLTMSKPPGVNLTGLVGAVTVMDTRNSPQRGHIFTAGSDGNLWVRWSDGFNWNWGNMGKPVSANIRGLMGAVTVMNTPTSSQRPHVFVEGNDFNLWCLWWSGSQWSWLNMGKPAGVNITGLVGAVTVMDTPTSPQRAHIFVTGSDGNLWCRWSNGLQWSWANMNKPPGANIRGLMGAVTVMDTPGSPQRPHVFIEGNDFNLWCLWWSGSQWSWLNMGKPANANITGLVGAITVMDMPTSPQRAHVFVTGSDGNLWCRWSSGVAWSWSNMGKPPGANIRGRMGAVNAKDTPTSAERPHVFVEGDDSNLWCLSWSG